MFLETLTAVSDVQGTVALIRMKGKKTRLSTSCPQKQGAHPSTKEKVELK